MTNDKTVTMSRELIEEVVAQLDDFITGDVLERLKSELAAPVVERQPDLEKIQVLESTISELQRDIRKQAHLINIITSEHQTPIVRQEPTAYVLHKNGEIDWDQEVIISNTGGDEQDERFQWMPVFATPVVERQPDAILEGCMTSVGITTVIYASTVSLKDKEQVKLFTSPPAPVAVAPVKGSYGCRSSIDGHHRMFGDGCVNCLDKVKELNQ